MQIRRTVRFFLVFLPSLSPRSNFLQIIRLSSAFFVRSFVHSGKEKKLLVLQWFPLHFGQKKKTTVFFRAREVRSK